MTRTIIRRIAGALVVVSGLVTQTAAEGAPISAVSKSFRDLGLAPGIDIATVTRGTRPSSPRRTKTDAATTAAPGIAVRQALIAQQNAGKGVGQGLIDESQHRTLQSLRESLNGIGSIEMRFNQSNGTPSFLRVDGGTVKPRKGPGARLRATARDIAVGFLDENRALLKLADPASELQMVTEFGDAQNKQHFRFQQFFKGVPVWGQQLGVHVSNTGVYLLHGRFQPTPKRLNVTPKKTPAEAVASAAAHLGVASGESPSSLTIFPSDDKGPLLAYQVTLAPSLDVRWTYIIDANTGSVLHRIKDVHTAGSITPGGGQDLLGQNRSFNVWSENGQFYLVDPSTPDSTVGEPIAQGPGQKGDTFILDVQNGDGTNLAYISNTTASVGWDSTAVSAMHNTMQVYRYYLDNFGRKSVDGNDKNLMVAVHFENQYNNAFWNGTFMIYGDGDDKVFSSLAKCLDVAAHEMTHGVIENSAGLIYQNQSGALNESFADVFAAMVDTGNWTLGEDCTVALPGFLRNMADPAQGLTEQPVHMSQYRNLPNTPDGDNGGVHINSGIPNRAAYLIADGLTLEGSGTSIGRAKTQNIYYRALTTYLTASAQFIDARRALIQAAIDLHGSGSAEVLAVAAAWDAVGVIEGGVATPDNRAPAPTDAVTGTDLMVYLYPLDDSHDGNPNDAYRLYAQFMATPFNGYDQQADIPLTDQIAASYTRPAAYTGANGTLFLFVGADANVYAVESNSITQLTDTGDIWSIALAPSGRYFAYTTTSSNDNAIHVVDLTTPNAPQIDIPIVPPSYQDGGGAAANTILYADALSFDYTGSVIVFDALNCVSTETSSCSVADGGYRYWSVGLLNVNNRMSSFPFPNQTPLIDLGNPTFAANNDYVIALDLQDYSDSQNAGVRSAVITIDLENQTASNVIDFDYGPNPHWGVPSFWGDDAYITVQYPVATASNIAAARVPLNAQFARDPDNPIEEVNPYAVAMPVLHRAGVRQLSGALNVSAVLLDFGDVESGGAKDLTFTLTNSGNRDVNITNILLEGGAFSHNATNTRLPRGAAMTITVRFQASGAGTQSGTLTIQSDGAPSALGVSLTGNGTVAPPPGSNTGGKNSSATGGGGTLDLVVLGVLLLIAWTIATRRPNAFHSAKRRF